MPTKRNPRRSSLQFWPRVRAQKETARIRSWSKPKEATLAGFPAYKAGMTHIKLIDPSSKSLTKKSEIIWPATVVECPPIKIIGATFYKRDSYGLHATTHIFTDKLDKTLSKKLTLPKKQNKKLDDLKPEEFTEIRALVQTQPTLTNIKKKPELMEIPVGGNISDAYQYIKDNLGKEIRAESVFKDGTQLDSHSVTKGKGTSGPVKRHGVAIRVHKSEKTKRGPGSLGPWHGHKQWRVAHQGQHGYHLRTEYNKLLLKIGKKGEEVNPKGGFVRYGEVKGEYMLIKGSLGGPKKRLITLTHAKRPNKQIPNQAPNIVEISTISQQ